MNKKNIFYIGIDQTGAIDYQGIPKPLAACAVKAKSVLFFYLKKLDLKELEKHLGVLDPHKTVICLDCVIGLPDSCETKWSEALDKVLASKGYGRKVASAFFHDLGRGVIHKRRIEAEVKTNSVFQEHPFQKNIQTGTYRFWKEIAERRKDFYAPAVERKKYPNQIPLLEAYPSYSWKILLKSKSRDPIRLASLLRHIKAPINFYQQHAMIAQKDPNLADALLLALTAQQFYKASLFSKPNNEGHILGVPVKKFKNLKRVKK